MSNSSDDNATKARKTKDTPGTRGKAVSTAFPGTKGSSTKQSQVSGVQRYISDDQGTSSGGSGHKPGYPRSSDLGKILEAVKLLEEKHLSYVKSHQQRLITRLDESKESESDFRKAIQELEAQIYELMSEKNIPDQQ
ncbi:hypothetical protein NIES2100_21190 [Calothrix sp. NIES-2100]|uniref:hypothetical protein n=1 Tax=Calothrix sp. NIES-2100 TaxID=1954172 RepID=UPI000B61D440|nr:hypothetical protein NIES2100_21190 [Calothrix sp. NIES-2100]